MEELKNVKDVAEFTVSADRTFHSASHEEIMQGATADLYFVRSRELLAFSGREHTPVTAEIFCTRAGVLAGIEEALNLLRHKKISCRAVPEGEAMEKGEVVMRIQGPYSEFGMYETALLGMLASASGWATAARICREAAQGKPVYCFGARHLHPAVAPVMERAAIIGGAENCSCILGAKLMGREPIGTVPHAAVLIVGDTVETALLYERSMPQDAARIILVDTFKDEVEESLRVAEALQERLHGVRLDTPGERGGVTPGLVREVRARLDQAGFAHVKIFVSGGINAERIPPLLEAGADAFGVGSFISGSRAIDMTMDLKEIDGKPVAKRGRIPGLADNPRLQKHI